MVNRRIEAIPIIWKVLPPGFPIGFPSFNKPEELMAREPPQRSVKFKTRLQSSGAGHENKGFHNIPLQEGAPWQGPGHHWPGTTNPLLCQVLAYETARYSSLPSLSAGYMTRDGLLAWASMSLSVTTTMSFGTPNPERLL